MLEAMTTTSAYEDVVDLRHYPIGEPGSAEYRTLVQVCRDQLRDRGVAQLSGFLAPAAVSEMIAESGQAGGPRVGQRPVPYRLLPAAG